MLSFLKSVWFLPVVFSLLKLWLTNHLPIQAINAPHDHLRYVRMASEVFDFTFPFEYDQFTLIRQPGYPFFLYIGYVIGLPLKFWQELSYIGVGFFFAWSVHKYYQNKLVTSLFLLLYIFAPGSFSWSRLTLQESLYLPLTVFIFSCLIHLINLTSNKINFLRWSVILGIGIAWFWNVRPEGIWILPTLIFAYVLIVTKTVAFEANLNRTLARIGYSFAAVLLPVVVVTSALSLTTYLKYGIFSTNDLSASGVKAAYSSLLSVSPDNRRAKVPVPRKTRYEIYSASPTFNQLSVSLEGKQRAWFSFGCKLSQICDDYTGAVFIWALRAAVANVGQYKSAPATEAFYRQIASEVRSACQSGLLKCKTKSLSVLSSFAPDLRFQDIKAFWNSLGSVSQKLVSEVTKLDISSGSREEWLRREYSKLSKEPTDIRLQRNEPLSKLKDNLITWITKVYQTMFTTLIGVGIVGVLLQHSYINRRKNIVTKIPLYLSWLLLSCILARVLLLVYIDATSFPAGGRYIWCILPLILMITSIGISYIFPKINLTKFL